MAKKALFFVLLILIGGSLIMAQEVSEKKEIAVFALSYYDYKVPSQALGMVDEQIKNVFVNLGRFKILGMNYRLSGNGVNEFIAKIREFKEQNVEIPEEVQLGQEAFTEADFNQLVNSFIVVIPVMSYYNLSVNDDGDYKAEIRTNFTLVDVRNIETTAFFTIETDGYSGNAAEAVKSDVDEITIQMQYEIRKIPEFQIKSGIVDVLSRSKVVIQFGSDMGLKKGDEYAIVQTEERSSGYTSKSRKALLVIREVEEDHSIAQVVYSKDGRPMIGEQVQEIPKLGLDTTVYTHALLDFFGSGGGMTFGDGFDLTVGFRQSFSRGFFLARPLAGLEMPISQIRYINAVPLTLYGGGELDLWFGRFQLVPTAAAGLNVTFPLTDSDEVYLAHLGFLAQLNFNYLIGDMVRLSLETGYSYFFRVNQYFDSYGGVLAGLAVQIRY